MSFSISNGSPLVESRTGAIAPCGQRATHTPQPMQATGSMQVLRFAAAHYAALYSGQHDNFRIGYSPALPEN